MGKIQDLVNDRHKYKVDKTYQRDKGAWSKEDEQCLIDTILKGEPMPLFFLNYISKESVFYIVDGQQRINAILGFYDNKLKLNEKFSGKENHGKTFNDENVISDEQRKQFLDYNLSFRILEDYDDENVRVIFSRLQRGKPLNLGERLNAKPGSIVQRMREIASNPFLAKSVGVYKEKYGVYPDAARILFYEKNGIKQMGSPELYNFFEENRDLTKDDKDFKNIVSTLRLLSKIFPSEPGDYQYLGNHAWIMAVYMMINELSISYSLIEKEDVIRTFVEDFHGKIYTEDFRVSNSDYQRFYDNIRGGWSEKIIALRKNTLIKEFLKKHKIDEFDDKRQISDEEKIEIFHRDKKQCKICRKSFKDYSKAEYHHVKRYADGGVTNKDNIVTLCTECHDKIHGKANIEIPSEKERNEIEE